VSVIDGGGGGGGVEPKASSVEASAAWAASARGAKLQAVMRHALIVPTSICIVSSQTCHAYIGLHREAEKRNPVIIIIIKRKD